MTTPAPATLHELLDQGLSEHQTQLESITTLLSNISNRDEINEALLCLLQRTAFDLVHLREKIDAAYMAEIVNPSGMHEGF
jgi:hypothetical protein